MSTKDGTTRNAKPNETRNASDAARPEQRPWISPQFERIPLNEALAGTPAGGGAKDGTASYAS